MQYRFNWKAFLLVAGVVLASGIGLYAAHRFQQPLNARSLLSRVERAEEEGRLADKEGRLADKEHHLNQAIRFLDRYLTLNPTNTDERYHYADLLERAAKGEPTRFLAIEVYQKVLQQDPGRLDARRRAAILMTEAGRWKDAIEHLQILRDKFPTDDTVETLLGRCYDIRGNSEAVRSEWGTAVVSFEKARTLRGVEPKTFARLAECYHHLELEKEAEAVLEEMIESERFHDDFRAYLIRANYRSLHEEALFKLTQQVIEDLESAKVPELVRKRLMLFVQRKDEFMWGEFEGKIVAILNGKEITPALKPDEKKRFQNIILKHADPAVQDLKTAKTLAPNEPDVCLAVAAAATKRGEQDEARSELERGLVHHPEDLKLCLALARWELANGHPEDAIARLRRGMAESADPEDKRVQADLAVTLIHQLITTGDLKEAGRTLTAAKNNAKLQLNSNDADLLTARLEMATGEWLAARPRLESLQGRVSSKSPQAALIYLLQSRIAGQVGDLDKQIELLEKSLDITSTTTARLEHAMALVEAGKARNALAEFQSLEKSLSVPACLAFARLEIARTLTMGEASRNWSKVNDLLDLAKQASPRILGMVIPSVTWFVTDAEVLTAKGQTEKAREILEWVCKASREDPAPWIALANLVSRSENPAAAQKILEEAKKVPKLKNLMSIFLAAQKPHEQAIEDTKLATEGLKELSLEEAAHVWGLAAALYLHLEEYDLARDAAAQVVAISPHNLQNQLLLFETAAQNGDSDSMQRAIEAIRPLDGPRGGMASYCDAFRLILSLSQFSLTNQTSKALRTAKVSETVLEKLNSIEKKAWFRDDFVSEIKKVLNGDETKQFLQAILKHAAILPVIPLNETGKAEMLSAARTLLTEADARRQGWPKVPLLWAQWYTLNGEHEKATDSYRRAFEQGERSFEVVLTLIRVYLARGKFHEAQVLIDRLDKETTSPTAQRMFTEVYLLVPNYSRALEAALKADLAKSDSANDHLMLGFLYAAAKNVPAAEKEFAKACELAKTPEPWVARVQFLLANKARNDAEAVFTGRDFLKFQERVPEGLVKLTLAQCCEILEPGAKADNAYLDVLKTAPSNRECVYAVAEYYQRTGRFAIAKPLFGKLIDGSVAGKPEEIREMRRHLAISMSESGDFIQCRKAWELIKQDADDEGEKRMDALARAAILAKTTGRKTEAIQLYATLDLYDQPLPVEARYVYGQLCFITGDIARGREQIKLAVSKSRENPTYVAYLANILIAERNLPDAQQWVNKLKDANPNRWLVVELQAQLDNARGKPTDAALRIAGYTPKNDSEALEMARRLEEYKDVKTAEKRLKAVVEDKDSPPFAALAYAAFLVRQKRVTESLNLCDTLIGKLPAPVVAGMALEFLGYGEDKRVYQRVQDWLAKAVGADARPAAFIRADALDRKGDYKGAIIAYRDLLDREKGNPLVLFPLARLVLLTEASANTEASAKEAEDYLTQAIAVSGPRSYLMELRAVAKLRQNHVAEAIEDLKLTIAEQPTATGYFLLAAALRDSDDKVRAETALRESTRRGSKALFKLTDDAIKALRAAKVPEPELQKLMKIEELPRETFEKKISEFLSPDQMQQFQSLILNHAGFNMSSFHPLEATEYRSLRDKAFRVSP